jgi:CubicO group peptidase (beta-lactamase class C family)
MSQPNLAPVEAVITAALDRVFPAAQVEVRQAGRVLLSRAYGWLDPDTRQHPTQPDTLFDLASVTKLFVVTAFMTLVEQGRVGLDDPVATVLPAFSGLRPIQPYEDPLEPGAFVAVNVPASGAGGRPMGGLEREGVDAGAVTFRRLLAHNSGLPAWRPLYKEGNPEAARCLALTTYFSYPLAARVIYSDIGLILLGMAVEQLTGQRLDEAVRARVTQPLRVSGIGYLPVEKPGFAASPDDRQMTNDERRILKTPYLIPGTQSPNIAPTEICAWRGRRIIGEVHDENAYGLGGIAGHAGLFATATDLATFGQSFLAAMPIPDTQYPLRAATIAEMTRLQSQDGMTRRGLGFALWSPDPEASSNPLSQAAFGHTGFTGASLWMDPAHDLVIACLTNRVYYGRDAGGILEFRVALHRAVVEAVG